MSVPPFLLDDLLRRQHRAPHFLAQDVFCLGEFRRGREHLALQQRRKKGEQDRTSAQNWFEGKSGEGVILALEG